MLCALPQKQSKCSCCLQLVSCTHLCSQGLVCPEDTSEVEGDGLGDVLDHVAILAWSADILQPLPLCLLDRSILLPDVLLPANTPLLK
jgi:hypothetical protein